MPDPAEIEEIENLLDSLRKDLRQLEEGQHVSLTELFPPVFMAEYTDAADIETFLTESGQFAPEDLAGGLDCTICETGFESPNEVFNSEAFDRYVTGHSSFSSWDEMLTTAVRRWLSRKLTPDDG